MERQKDEKLTRSYLTCILNIILGQGDPGLLVLPYAYCTGHWLVVLLWHRLCLYPSLRIGWGVAAGSPGA